MAQPNPSFKPTPSISAASWRVRCMGGPLDGATVEIGHRAHLDVPLPHGGMGRYERDPAAPAILRYLGPLGSQGR